jgi:hypothetical protein
MDVAVSVHDAPVDPSGEKVGEVHLVEVHDSRGGFLCRLFLQPLRGGCQVQLDALGDSGDDGERPSLSVVEAATTVLIGVRRRGPAWTGG